MARLFRPMMNMNRMNSSMARLAMPVRTFVQSRPVWRRGGQPSLIHCTSVSILLSCFSLAWQVRVTWRGRSWVVTAAAQTFDGEQYLECLKKLVALDKDWIPDGTFPLACVPVGCVSLWLRRPARATPVS